MKTCRRCGYTSDNYRKFLRSWPTRDQWECRSAIRCDQRRKAHEGGAPGIKVIIQTPGERIKEAQATRSTVLRYNPGAEVCVVVWQFP